MKYKIFSTLSVLACVAACNESPSDMVEENPRLVAGGNDAEETEVFNYNFGYKLQRGRYQR